VKNLPPWFVCTHGDIIFECSRRGFRSKPIVNSTRESMESSSLNQTAMFLLSSDEDWDNEVFEDDFEEETEEVFEDEWEDEEDNDEWEDSEDHWSL